MGRTSLPPRACTAVSSSTVAERHSSKSETCFPSVRCPKVRSSATWRTNPGTVAKWLALLETMPLLSPTTPRLACPAFACRLAPKGLAIEMPSHDRHLRWWRALRQARVEGWTCLPQIQGEEELLATCAWCGNEPRGTPSRRGEPPARGSC